MTDFRDVQHHGDGPTVVGSAGGPGNLAPLQQLVVTLPKGSDAVDVAAGEDGPMHVDMVLRRQPTRGPHGSTPGALTVAEVRESVTVDGDITTTVSVVRQIHAVGVLEDAIREIPGRKVSSWKVAGATCIPAGRYRCVKHKSPRFGWVIHITGIPGYDLVYFHGGNTPADTLGCPLVGKVSGDGTAIVGGTSAPARAALEAVIFPYLERDVPVWCTVVNPRSPA